LNFYDAVREVSIRTGISETEACEKIGKKKSYISSARLRGSVPQIDNASMIVDAFGWELVAIPKGSVLDDAIPITSERKQGSDDDNRRQIAAMQRKLESLQRQSEELQKRLVDMG
jgi:hypothetical protein